MPLTQEQGERTDAVVQVGYDSKRPWSTYGFVQDTLSRRATATRKRPRRHGRLVPGHRAANVDAEVSNGDLGPGGKVGTNYLHERARRCT